MKKPVLAIFAILIFVGLAFYLSQPSSSDEQTTSKEKEPEKDLKGIAEKLVRYNPINGLTNKIIDSYNRYLSWVDWKTGPTGKEERVNGLYDIYSIDFELQSLNEALDKGVTIKELDEITIIYRNELEITFNLIKEAYEYYRGEYYKDDNFAKGQRMHQPLMKAFQKYFAADAKLCAALQVHHKELHNNTAKKIKENEYGQLVSKSYLIIDKAHEAYLYGENVNELADFEIAGFSVLVDAYESLAQDLKTYAQNNKEEQDQFSSYHLFLGEIDDFSKTIRGIRRRVNANETYSHVEKRFANWQVDGSHWKMIAEFEEMSSRYNGLWKLPIEVFFHYIPIKKKFSIAPEEILFTEAPA